MISLEGGMLSRLQDVAMASWRWVFLASGCPRAVAVAFLTSIVLACVPEERDPYDLAAKYTGLGIPMDAVLLEFTDNRHPFLADAHIRIVFQLDSVQFSRLASEAVAAGYEEMGIDSVADSTRIASRGYGWLATPRLITASRRLRGQGGLMQYSSDKPVQYEYTSLNRNNRRLTTVWLHL